MPLACCTAPGLIQTNTQQLWGQELQCTINPVVLQLILILFTVILVQSSKTRPKHTKSANCNLGVPWPRDQLQFKKRLVAVTALLEFTLPDPSDFCYIQGTLDMAKFLCASLRCHFGTAARAPLFQKCSSGLSSRNSWCFPGWDQLGWPVNTVLLTAANTCSNVPFSINQHNLNFQQHKTHGGIFRWILCSAVAHVTQTTRKTDSSAQIHPSFTQP